MYLRIGIWHNSKIISSLRDLASVCNSFYRYKIPTGLKESAEKLNLV